MTPPGPDDERFEHIPWEHLRPASNDRRWSVYAVAGAIVVGALAFSFARDGGQEGMAIPATGASATTLAVGGDEAATTPTASVTTTSIGAAVSEADLMAVPPDRLAAEAAAWAEWVTRIYLTIDGSEITAGTLEEVLPPGLPLPAPSDGQRLFVEWVRTVEVAESGIAEFRAVVAARTLGAIGEQSYERLPDRALEWRLHWTPDGWSVVDLPNPVEFPRLVPPGDLTAGELTEAELPHPVIQAASELGEVREGWSEGELFRVVVELVDPFGGRWPAVLWYDSDGQRVDRP
ncbi:MAG: hypothetical protein ACT4OP_09850 [Actinomycetota bacterium]